MRYILFLLVLLPLRGNAQLQINGEWQSGDTSQVQVLTMVRGDEFRGYLLQYDSTGVMFKLDIGDTLRYGLDEVKMVEVLPAPPHKPKTAPTSINERLLVSPTGFTLNKGKQEYRNIMFLYNSYHYGVTDNITVGGGIMPMIITYLGWVDAKVSLELYENLHIAAGGLIGGGHTISFSEDGGESGGNNYSFTGGFSSLTIGSKVNFINFSVARIAIFEELGDSSSPWLYSTGSSHKVGKNNRLFVEAGNYIGNYEEWTVSLGISTLYKRNSFDAAIQFFPSSKPWGLPAFAYAKRF
jgi:hypothetical protein